MIEVEVKSILNIKSITGNKDSQYIHLKDKSSVKDALDKLVEIYGEELERNIYDDKNNTKKGITILHNGSSILAKRGLDTELKDKDRILIFPPVGGG